MSPRSAGVPLLRNGGEIDANSHVSFHARNQLRNQWKQNRRSPFFEILVEIVRSFFHEIYVDILTRGSSWKVDQRTKDTCHESFIVQLVTLELSTSIAIPRSLPDKPCKIPGLGITRHLKVNHFYPFV